MISFPTSFLLSIIQLFLRPLTLLSIPLIWFTSLRSTLNSLFGSFLFHQQTVHSWDSSGGPVFHGRRAAYGVFQFLRDF